MKLLNTNKKNDVLQSMMTIIDKRRNEIVEANKKDLESFNRNDQALYDRLVVDQNKVDGMIQAIKEVKEQEDPVGNTISERTLDTGLKIVNKTDPFGTIMIIYESRPDVTIEAAVLAFKANNKIFLKGGKEANHSNIILEECWHQALEENGLSKEWITLLHLNREETREFLSNPPEKMDLIVPRGGEKLIDFVKRTANCAVLVSGRGNNFLYVAPDADWDIAKKVIINAKTDKISGCNALDKVLFDSHLPDLDSKIKELAETLENDYKVEILVDGKPAEITDYPTLPTEDTWKEEFLALKIVLGSVDSFDEAVEMINKHSGGHSSVIITEDHEKALEFMQEIDCAAVYQNASTRFTDGGQMGVGAELAISTDKLHHRGPLGLKQLVTNKYYVWGDGHIRE
ncbi:glutamate-5-semialdehyde dehydrogenase [Psychroflexus sediminis]|uniref:Gamma-glutamyl phosphate reductase n=1 Tax=Psychroflexus sediminis TaxID=470826 RepID=A0A1G7VDY3_9FLAO|nr:glutamate-5-semialdehyde dehydrogenase [Psychroflexus sediminis]SDG57768.1 glutamate-5-semialdehyde dehydrogenase [Psychroflexus sediminis]